MLFPMFFFLGGGGLIYVSREKKTEKEIAGVFAVFRYYECHY